MQAHEDCREVSRDDDGGADDDDETNHAKSVDTSTSKAK
jgi:hypothetical protein